MPTDSARSVCLRCLLTGDLGGTSSLSGLHKHVQVIGEVSVRSAEVLHALLQLNYASLVARWLGRAC